MRESEDQKGSNNGRISNSDCISNSGAGVHLLPVPNESMYVVISIVHDVGGYKVHHGSSVILETMARSSFHSSMVPKMK